MSCHATGLSSSFRAVPDCPRKAGIKDEGGKRISSKNGTRKTKLLFPARFIFLLFLFLLCPNAASAMPIRDTEPAPVLFSRPSVADPKLILVLADRLSYPILRAHAGPVLQELLEQGTIALMNARSAGSGSESGYLTLGAGARAVAGPEGGQAFERGETIQGEEAELVFARHTGRFPAGAVFHLQLATLRRRNAGLGYPVEPGYLGSLLARQGKIVAVAGNAGAAAGSGTGITLRGAALVAMDQNGLVPLGLVGNTVLEEAPLAPFGYRTDLDVLGGAAVSFLEQAHLVVLDFGDFYRLDQCWAYLDEGWRNTLLAETAVRLDLFLGQLLPCCDAQTMLLLVVPSPPRNLPGGEEALVPFLMTGGACPPGLAASSNTRRPGLVTNTDLVPLATAFLVDGIRPGDASFPLAPVISLQRPAPATLDCFFSRAVRLYRQRPPVLKGYVLLVIVAVLISLAGLALRFPPVACLAATFLEALLLVPLVLLLLSAWPAFPFPSAALSGVVLGAGTLALAGLTSPLKKRAAGAPFFWAVIGLVGTGLILADGLSGSTLQQFSFLGYDVIGGSRYYGTGNEYMGALIGTALTGTTALIGLVTATGPGAVLPSGSGAAMAGPAAHPGDGRRLQPWSIPLWTACAVSVLLYGVIVYILASPRFGANLGGTVAAAVAFSVASAGTWSALRGSGLKRCLGVALPAGLSLAALLLWLLNFGPLGGGTAPSHLGRLGLSMQSRGAAVLWETISRKVSMNWKLVRYSIWSRALVTFLGLLAVLCFYPLGLLRRLGREQPHLLVGAAAGAAGGVAALLANDSGVVAAAMILLFTVPPLLSAVTGLARRELFSAGKIRQE